MACARFPKGDLVLSLVFLPTFLGLSVWLALTGSGPERLIGILGLFLWLCLLLSAVGPGRYCVAGSELFLGRRRLSLAEVQEARVASGSRCPFFPGLRLVLRLREGRAVALPLTYAGWEAVYEAIRAARPDLSLRPWQEEPFIRQALRRGGRPLVHLPEGAVLYRENGTLALFSAILLFFALTLLGALVPRSLTAFWIGVVVYATLALYDRIAKPKVLLEDDAGRREAL